MANHAAEGQCQHHQCPIAFILLLLLATFFLATAETPDAQTAFSLDLQQLLPQLDVVLKQFHLLA